jgi:hypothetical protein
MVLYTQVLCRSPTKEHSSTPRPLWWGMYLIRPAQPIRRFVDLTFKNSVIRDFEIVSLLRCGTVVIMVFM